MVYSSTSSKTVGAQLDDDHPPTRVINGVCYACRFEVSRTFDGDEVHAPAPANVNRAMQFVARRPPLSTEETHLYDVIETLQGTSGSYVSTPDVLEELRRRGVNLADDVVNNFAEKEAHWGRIERNEEQPTQLRVVFRPVA